MVKTAIDKDGNVKYDAVTGAKGYRWLEAEMVKTLGKEDDIDLSYYNELVDSAVHGSGSGASRKPGISDFGDFEWFVSDDPYIEAPSSVNADMHPVEQPFDTIEDDDPPWYDDAELFMKR